MFNLFQKPRYKLTLFILTMLHAVIDS